jgi:hypothetical protein
LGRNLSAKFTRLAPAGDRSLFNHEVSRPVESQE